MRMQHAIFTIFVYNFDSNHLLKSVYKMITETFYNQSMADTIFLFSDAYACIIFA